MKILFIAYDNGSYIPFFPQGIAYLSKVLRNRGYEVTIYSQDISHAPDRDITRYIDENEFDIVGLGFCAGYYQYQKCYSIARAVNASANRKKFAFILGGHGPSAAPEYFMEKYGADTIIIGEAEKEIMSGTMIRKAKYQRPLSIYGFEDLIYCGIFQSNPMPLSEIPWPDYENFNIDIYKLIRWPTSTDTDFCMPILSGRGCPYKCAFCYRMHEGDFRPREPEDVIQEMQYLIDRYRITHFQFSDELFMSSRKRIGDFCESLLIAFNGRIKWDCNGRLNFAKPDELNLMKEAGCEYINYGIESLDQTVLNNIHKGLTVDQIWSGVQETIRAGLTPGLNILWGNPGDTIETLRQAVDFLIQLDTCRELRTIRPVTPYPGTELFKLAVERGLIKDVADFYENKHVNSDLLTCNFTDVPEYIFHNQLMYANMKLYLNYMSTRKLEMNKTMQNFYSGKTKNFRGFRPV